MCALVTGVQTCALPIWLARRLQALQHDLELLILGPASPPTRLHNFQPLNLGTARITVHKDSSQHHASPWQGGLPRILTKNLQYVKIILCCSHGYLRCAADDRSEEHTSELQSLMRISYAVF